MSIDQIKIHNYIQAYGKTLKNLNLAISEQEQQNIYLLIILLGELDDLYDNQEREITPLELQKIKQKMLAVIPDSLLRQKTIDSLFESMLMEAKNQQHSSLAQYLENSSITSGVHLIAGYLASIFHISSQIWYSQWVNSFGYEVASIVRLANDYLDLSTSQYRFSAEAPQENSINFFPNKLTLKLFIAYKYILHKARYYTYILGLKCLTLFCNCTNYLNAFNCYESVLQLGFKVYFVDQQSCRD